MKSLAAAIIAKNNEKTILNTLNSIKNICSQIIVVDTGSSDKTVETAIKFGAEVHFNKWNDDFSEARNYALKLIRSPWILIIDTDEIIKSFDKYEFSKIISNYDCGGINIKIENLLENKTISTHSYTRILKNHQDIRFIGSIHEQIKGSIDNLGLKVYDSSIIIEHSGYLIKSSEKILRNKILLEKQYQELKDDWTIYHLANTEFSNGDFQRAMELYLLIENSIEITKSQNEMVKIRLAQIFLNKKEKNKIPELLNFLSEDIDIEGFKNYILLSYYSINHQISEAENLLNNTSLYQSKMVDKLQIDKIKSIINKLKKYF